MPRLHTYSSVGTSAHSHPARIVVSANCCEVKDQLMIQCETANGAYSRVVLSVRGGARDESACVKLERLQQGSEEAQQELDNHLWEHGC